ncbi:MAG TPA: CocE/NonD family hydrolase [Thermoanaerobaculia bacterium]|nr:CocE/NonD family hydrolase [Thermoanaerobaculia bacterium]
MIATEQKERILFGRRVRARDGVELATDVYLPDDDTPRPAIVVRTPYGRNLPFLLRLASQLRLRGYAVVTQDSRGRYQSQGVYNLETEERDTFDTLEWLGEQTWADGRVALIGISITGYPNLLAAAAPPPAGVEICALINIMGAVDHYSMFYRGGALVHHWALPWTTMMGSSEAGRTRWLQQPWAQLLRHLPLVEAPDRAGADGAFWRTVVTYPAYVEFWRQMNALERIGRIPVPTLHLSGWYDFMLGQTLMAYRQAGLAAEPGDPPQRLAIGPWDHRTTFTSFVLGGDGTDERSKVDLLELAVAWFDRWLGDPERARRAEANLAGQPPVQLFVAGLESWLGSESFPPAGVSVEDWYLVSGGSANTLGGDGRLQPEQPLRLGQDSFAYDPTDPVPTTGGAIWPLVSLLQPGPAAQLAVERRPDVLVYSSPPLAADKTAVGFLEVELWASTSARDTDFTAKLVDVDPQGVPRIVQDGIQRGRFVVSAEREQLLDPHRPYRFLIRMEATAHCFRAGHRIRLEVSSSNFPKFDRNLNTALPFHTATEGMVAQQTVYHGGAMPSRLRLPVLPPEVVESLLWQPPSAGPSWEVGT